MKTIIFLLSAVLLFGCNNTIDNNNKSNSTILLKSTGFIESVPDEATIYIHLSCVDKNIQRAKSCLIDKTEKLTSELLSSGIQKPDILTTNVNLNKEFNWINNSNVFKGYNASTSMNVKVRDLEILDGLYTKLLGNEQLTIGSLTYQHSNIDSLNALAYIKALESADYTAEKILDQLPQENKEIIQISNIEISRSDNRLKAMSFEADLREENQMTVNVGNIVVEQRLFVEYRIY
jgi:uncharacterized protein YggE